MMPYHVRLAELFLLQKQRQLTDAEVLDLTHCMAANAKYCWDLVTLHNFSYAAYAAGDMAWLHEICAQIDALEERQTKIKRPDRRGTDRK
ncbi:hypothetical protein FE783_12505 [Paenibacillus mesophilus]|nr:hypothetical protein FE783_12505 [Paenibacillus mesophilus]